MEKDGLADLAILEDANEQVEQDKPLQKIKIKKGEKPVTDNAVVSESHKQKRERSEKQKEITKKMIEARNAKIIISKEKQALEDALKKKELEEKIVKKAIAIKKKEIKRKAVLDEISDDETPIEEIKKVAMKVKPAVKRVVIDEPPAPKTFFEKYRFI